MARTLPSVWEIATVGPNHACHLLPDFEAEIEQAGQAVADWGFLDGLDSRAKDQIVGDE